MSDKSNELRGRLLEAIPLGPKLHEALACVDAVEEEAEQLQDILQELLDATLAGDDLLGREKSKLKALIKRAMAAGVEVFP